MLSKFLILLKNPKTEYKKILPYLKSRVFFYKKKFYEFLKIDKLSKPYPGHQKILKYLDFEDGFFIECGANDGYFQDPTYYLEKFKNWRGILVEPLPKVFKNCLKNRKRSKVYNYALVSPDFSKKIITLCDCNAMTVVKGSFEGYENWIKSGEIAQNIISQEIEVSAKTLQSLIDEYFNRYGKRKIDLLVADVEGYELEVLKGLDFNKNTPEYLLIEMQTEERKIEIEKYISRFGYNLIEEVGNRDFLYKK